MRASHEAVSGRAEDATDVVAALAVLWGGKWILASAAALGLLLGLAAARFLLTPRYQSEAVLILDQSPDLGGGAPHPVPGLGRDISAINTQIEVLNSHQMMRNLVRHLSLDGDPEFNPALRPGPLRLGADPTPVAAADETANAVATEVRRAFAISNIRNSYALSIVATSTDPDKSAELANALASLFVQGQVDTKHADVDSAVDWLSARVVTLEQDLTDQEAILHDLQTQVETANADEPARRLSEARNRIDSLRQRRGQLLEEKAHLGALRAAGPAGLTDADLEDGSLNLLARDAQAGDGAALAAFFDRVSLLSKRADRDLSLTDEQALMLEQAIARLEGEIAETTALVTRQRQVERDARATALLHETFLTRLKETTLRRGLQTADSRIISPATPGTKIAPATLRLGIVGMLCGAALAACFLFLTNYHKSGIPDAQQLEAATRVAVLGHMPRAPIRDRRQLVEYLAGHPTSPLAEAARNLRTSLLLSGQGLPPKVILCTSSAPDEGKTTTAISLAHNLAGLGRSVLLIEADIRRLSFRDYFSENPDGGLVSAMEQGAALDRLIRPDSRLGVDILMGERSDRSAADLFSSPAFGRMLQDLRKEYDHILIDSPPVLAVPDARVLGQLADAILLSVAVERTGQSCVQDALRELASVNLKVSGLVMSDLKPARGPVRRTGQAYGVHARYYGV